MISVPEINGKIKYSNVKKVYKEIKSMVKSIDKTLVFNPQKYYISIKSDYNIAYLTFFNNKMLYSIYKS